MIRKIHLVNGEVYHIYSRSIAAFVIFNHPNEYARMYDLLAYCMPREIGISFSHHRRKLDTLATGPSKNTPGGPASLPHVRIIAYCLMPTHIHLILQQTTDGGITAFMHRVLTGFTKFFNILHKRKGPLWESRFQSRHVDTNEYLLHLSRYVHLNPVKAKFVKRAQDWDNSSYREYIGPVPANPLCEFKRILPYSPAEYRKLTEDHLTYQAGLAKIGHLLIDRETQA